MRVTEPASTENITSKRSISFAATYFGTDLLCAAWALLVSSFMYYIIMKTLDHYVFSFFCLVPESAFFFFTVTCLMLQNFKNICEKKRRWITDNSLIVLQIILNLNFFSSFYFKYVIFINVTYGINYNINFKSIWTLK